MFCLGEKNLLVSSSTEGRISVIDIAKEFKLENVKYFLLHENDRLWGLDISVD